MSDKLRVVADSERMSEDIFVKHVNKSHMPIAGLTEITAGRHLPSLRAYHARVHEVGTEDEEARPVNHTHQGSA